MSLDVIQRLPLLMSQKRQIFYFPKVDHLIFGLPLNVFKVNQPHERNESAYNLH